MSLTGVARRDGRIDRGESTRLALMRAAENLIAERGIENAAVKDIVRETAQSNASALQYHFGSLQALSRTSGPRAATKSKRSVRL